MPRPIDSERLKQFLLERRSYPLMIVGAVLFPGSWFVSGSALALIGWIVFMVDVIEYFRGFR